MSRTGDPTGDDLSMKRPESTNTADETSSSNEINELVYDINTLNTDSPDFSQVKNTPNDFKRYTGSFCLFLDAVIIIIYFFQFKFQFKI